jgi:histone H3/H4
VGRRIKAGYEIPLAPLERILRQEGGYRVSEEAVEKLRDVVEKLAREIAKVSVDMSKHAGRRTIKAEDVEVALKVVLGRMAGSLAP